MGEMKIQEEEFFYILSLMKRTIEEESTQKEKEEIKTYIIKQQEIRSLMFERKAYFDFYQKNKGENPKVANLAYAKYIECKKRLQSLRGDS